VPPLLSALRRLVSRDRDDDDGDETVLRSPLSALHFTLYALQTHLSSFFFGAKRSSNVLIPNRHTYADTLRYTYTFRYSNTRRRSFVYIKRILFVEHVRHDWRCWQQEQQQQQTHILLATFLFFTWLLGALRVLKDILISFCKYITGRQFFEALAIFGEFCGICRQ